ncbi:MAG: DUF1016 domain-containing protein [Anaeroplasmataceae bacterium]|nr:DUF1016 domain-containing protein [Anaeroplasmataceae bacterium]
MKIDFQSTENYASGCGHMYIYMYDELNCTDGDDPTIDIVLCAK